MAPSHPGESTAHRLAPGIAMFVGGAVLMTVEIVGGLTIAPYFGSNVFVWGSIISVFLAALAAGYRLGGKFAGSRAGGLLLAGLLAAAGALILAIPWLAPLINRAMLSVDLGERLNPLRILIAAAGSFFLPTLLLGMISPIAVGLAAGPLQSVGRSVGRLYALNALGSVAGALCTTFILVLFFGNRSILWGCGSMLILAAVIVALARSRAASPTVSAPAAGPAAAPPLPHGLRPLVLAVGMVLMSLEVLAGAVIAPYFGSSVFVWGSVIAVFLGAMTLGYRAGGRLADRRPSPPLLAGIVAAGGLFVLLVPILTPLLCKSFQSGSFGGTFDILRPLAAAATLYFIPTFFFAMVAPFAVRLAAAHPSRIGDVAGRLYSLSTLGNAVGVLLTTFLLISTIGKTRTLEAAGALAVAAAVTSLAASKHARPAASRSAAPSVALVAVAAALIFVPKPPLVAITYKGERIESTSGDWKIIADSGGLRRRIRAEFESPYHHIAVIEEIAGPYGNRRQLRFDQYVESAVELDGSGDNIRRPYTSATTYADMLHLPLLFQPNARDALIIGGGGGVVPTIFRTLYPRMNIDVVEIDPVVVDVAEKWFALTPDAQLRVHVQDGRMFVHNSPQQFDIIILDAYTAGGRIPTHLTTREFLDDVRSHLRPDGVVLMNVISALKGQQSDLFRAELKTFHAVFEADHVYAVPKVLGDRRDDEQSTNVMLIATGPAQRRLARTRCLALAEERYGDAPGKIPLPSIPNHASQMLTDAELAAIPLADVPVLTDDFAPVDLMVARFR